MTREADVVVIGGGPAGAAAARVLAGKGHSVILLARAPDPLRARAESLPPSARRVLSRIGVLDAVEAAGFYQTTGNTVWWGDREGDVELFGGSGEVPGLQVFRPDFDRLLLNAATAAGALVIDGVTVRDVQFQGGVAHVTGERESGDTVAIDARYAIDASGRTGVIARRGQRPVEPGFSSQAFIGAWHAAGGWNVPDPTHTLVETYDDGWAYSIPVSATSRHIGVVVDGPRSKVAPGRGIERKYRSEIAKLRTLSALSAGATLERVWSCPASMYSASVLAGDGFVLVGDAGSCLEPLSSFGVKKALTSGWMGAIAVHTALRHTERTSDALGFFARWERQVYESSLRRSREYAREAHARHPHPFWAARAAFDGSVGEPELDERALFASEAVQAAFARLKAADRVRLVKFARPGQTTTFIRDDEIVVDEAIALPDAGRVVRFLADVDLVVLRDVACACTQVGEMLEVYQRTCGAAPVPNLLGALSVLLASGVVVEQ